MHLNTTGIALRFPRLLVPWTAVATLLVLCCADRGLSQQRQRVPDEARRQQHSASLNAGFLFVDGRYVAPPYQISTTQDTLRINDMEIALAEGQRRDRRKIGYERGRRPRVDPARRIQFDLRNGQTVVVFSGKPLVTLDETYGGRELLQLLCAPERQNTRLTDCEWLPGHADIAAWESWIASFQPAAEFRRRAEQELKALEAIEVQNVTNNNAVQRLDRAQYPLSVMAMLLTVLAFGHLLSYHPPLQHDAQSTDPPCTALDHRAFIFSLSLVGAFSAFDLTWTMLAAAAGSMRELNPIGSQLIANPTMLIAFKLAVTAVSVGLLFGLRRHAIARRAAWWACLALTLLMVRWLVFSSMFA